ncbi:hypothetical protein WDJ50_02580 [Deinococcus sp. VB142]|uniref:Uncharacterized protein n=1 Tax=Deinococcus sp. VB142 TaxID=3112952 RepID=A0AAU6Q450_9DEIO
MIAAAVADNAGELRLAAATLLEGLPTNQDGGLSSFKLDVLEFKFRDSKAVGTDWLAVAARLRAQAAEAGAGQVAANPAPFLEPWGVG